MAAIPLASQLTIFLYFKGAFKKRELLGFFLSFPFSHFFFFFLLNRPELCYSLTAPVHFGMEMKGLSVEHNTFAAVPQGGYKTGGLISGCSPLLILLRSPMLWQPKELHPLELEWAGGRKDSTTAVRNQPCCSRRPASAGVYPALRWVTGAMLHQSHLQQPPHESLQPEETCNNSWATRRMISLPAEGNKDKVTWNTAPGARSVAPQQRAFRWPKRPCDSALQDQTGQRSLRREERKEGTAIYKELIWGNFRNKTCKARRNYMYRVCKGLSFKQFSLHWLFLSPFWFFKWYCLFQVITM